MSDERITPKEIDDPRSTHPPTARSTLHASSTRHPGDLLGFVCDLGSLRRVRSECGPRRHDRPRDHRPFHYDERRDDDGALDHVNDHHLSQSDDHDRTHDGDDRTHDPDDAAHRANDADHAEEGHADHGLHSPDDRTGHHHDGVRVDAVRSGDLFLGRC
jgi:hypothetical protein